MVSDKIHRDPRVRPLGSGYCSPVVDSGPLPDGLEPCETWEKKMRSSTTRVDGLCATHRQTSTVPGLGLSTALHVRGSVRRNEAGKATLTCWPTTGGGAEGDHYARPRLSTAQQTPAVQYLVLGRLKTCGREHQVSR